MAFLALRRLVLLTIGLVGCGEWGKNVLRDLLRLGCQVRVASRGEASRSLARSMGAAEVVTSSEELPYCDGYVLATPIETLADEALKLIPRGKPIFSEKTLCPTLAEAERLLAAGAAGQVFLMHKWEYHNGVRAMRRLAESGCLGNLEQIQCQRHGWVIEGRTPDALTLLATHDLTIVRHILGFIPEPVYALIRCRESVPVGLTAVLGHEVRAVLSVEARHPTQSRSITLLGSKGSACLGDAYADHILIHDGMGERRWPFENNMPLLAELQEFVAYLEGGPEPACGFDHARAVAGVLDSLRRLGRMQEASGPDTLNVHMNGDRLP